MNWNRQKIVFFVFFLFCACDAVRKKDIKEFRVEKNIPVNDDLLIPSQVWNLLEADFKTFPVKGDAKMSSTAVTYFPFKVLLLEKTPGVLSGDNFILELGEGGGVIDLARYVKKGKRSFFIQFDFGERELDQMRTYFISEYLPQVKDDRPLGLKCDQALNISSQFFPMFVDERFLLNTSDWRYLNVIGGTFVFFYFDQATGVNVAQVTFVDERRKDARCRHSPSG